MDVEYIESKANYELAKELQEKYFPFIGYVNLDEIYFAEMIGYKSKKALPYQMSGITQSWVREILSSQSQMKYYCLSVHQDLWEELEESKKQWIIFKCLYSVSPQGEGKIRSFDVTDYGFIIEYFVRTGFGPYWEMKDNLPSLLGKDTLPLVIPMDDKE